MVEKALVAVIQEAWIGGVSTRRVDELVQAMGMTGISKSTVSKLCKDIDERVHAFLKRPLTGEWPYLWLDATYLKVREGGRIISVAAIIAMAVNTEGRREIVGLHIGPSEAEVFWSDFLKDLVRRGLTGVKLVISDAHEGLRARSPASWAPPGSAAGCTSCAMPCPMCPRARTLSSPPRSARSSCSPIRKAQRRSGDRSPTSCAPVGPSSAPAWTRPKPTCSPTPAFPTQHRTKLHSTNPLERLNKEVKRRADVVGIFPNEDSIIRLVGAVLMEQNDEWQLQHRYMQIEGMAELNQPMIEEENQPLHITAKAA